MWATWRVTLPLPPPNPNLLILAWHLGPDSQQGLTMNYLSFLTSEVKSSLSCSSYTLSLTFFLDSYFEWCAEQLVQPCERVVKIQEWKLPEKKVWLFIWFDLVRLFIVFWMLLHVVPVRMMLALIPYSTTLSKDECEVGKHCPFNWWNNYGMEKWRNLAMIRL